MCSTEPGCKICKPLACSLCFPNNRVHDIRFIEGDLCSLVLWRFHRFHICTGSATACDNRYFINPVLKAPHYRRILQRGWSGVMYGVWAVLNMLVSFQPAQETVWTLLFTFMSHYREVRGWPRMIFCCFSLLSLSVTHTFSCVLIQMFLSRWSLLLII